MALEILGDLKDDTITTEDKERINAIKLNCYNNLGIATFKYGDYHMTIDYCNKALDIDPINYKALLRLARAQKERSDYTEAKKTLVRTSKVKNTKEVHDLFEDIKKLDGNYQDSSTKLYENIFQDIKEEGGLYKDQKPEPPAMVECSICGEKMEEKQLARHTVKKHTEKKKFDEE